VAATGTDSRLDRIEHIVVLMLENRSFDHMLGYLSLEGGRDDVDGLKDGMQNEYGGAPYPPRRLKAGALLTKDHDPDHSGGATTKQINSGAMDGFVASYAETLQKRGVSVDDAGLIMGYHNAEDLPVYDHLAREFCVCDRWHSSVPGATWPNRLYAVSGKADGSRDDKTPAPLYDNKSFVRHLDAADVSWRWYSFDPATLRCVDSKYLLDLGHYHRFRFFDKATLRWQTAAEEVVVIDEASASFLQDAASGDLPAVSWIDPNFNDLNLWGSASNDDHPPSNVLDGQDLVFRVYHALATSPRWQQTLLVITYDEHGGFYDHVAPPEAPDDDPVQFGSYGVRVPAILVSPWVSQKQVCKTLFDHTSIIKTILTRFCPQELERRTGVDGVLHWLREGHPHYMGKRVASATSLAEVLDLDEPRAAPDHADLLELMAARRAEAARAVLTGPVPPATDRQLSDLQVGMAAAARTMRNEQQLPPGHP
jgi:phospholipase C